MAHRRQLGGRVRRRRAGRILVHLKAVGRGAEVVTPPLDTNVEVPLSGIRGGADIDGNAAGVARPDGLGQQLPAAVWPPVAGGIAPRILHTDRSPPRLRRWDTTRQ